MKVIFLLTVAILAAADVSDLSEEVVAAASHSSPVPFLKSKLTCLTNQLKVLKVCERMLYKVKGCKEESRNKVYIDCKDALQKGQRRSGIYTLDPDRHGSFQAYCDMQTDGGGWTVFQRREDGSVNFHRNWKDYVAGFGNLNGEHWLGLEKIYRLTKHSRNALRVDLGDYSGRRAYAKYNYFRLGNAGTQYTLHVSGYRGNAGDSLKPHNGMRFSTKDKDHDRWSRNCAATYKGGWWFNACHPANLNGLYSTTRRIDPRYNVWHSWKRRWESLKYTDMKLRRM